MKNYLDMTKIQKKYKGLWIVLNDKLDNVVTYDSNAKRAYEKAMKKGYKTPTLFKVPREITPYFGVFSI